MLTKAATTSSNAGAPKVPTLDDILKIVVDFRPSPVGVRMSELTWRSFQYIAGIVPTEEPNLIWQGLKVEIDDEVPFSMYKIVYAPATTPDKVT